MKACIFFLLSSCLVVLGVDRGYDTIRYSTICLTNTVTVTNSLLSWTGQTNSYAARDDGALQLGVKLPTPRFTIMPNTNCVKDNLTGLIWARNAYLFTTTNWSWAVSNCNNLDYGGTNDWRLPNIRELDSLIYYRYASPPLCSTAGTNQWSANDPFVNINAGSYWSSSTASYTNTSAWYVSMINGIASVAVKTAGYYVWPCRGP